MRKLLVFLLLSIAVCAQAQEESNQNESLTDYEKTWSITPRIGYSYSKMDKYAYGDERVDTKGVSGLTFGAEAEIDLSKWWTMSVGLIYSQEGAKISQEFSKIDDEIIPLRQVNISYISLPILFGIKPCKGFAIKTGLQFKVNVNESYKGITEDDPAINYNGIALAIPVGVSYEYKHFVLDARYALGITAFSADVNTRYHANTLSITLGYRIPIGTFKNKKPAYKDFIMPETI